MPRPCAKTHPLSPKTCRLCYLVENDESYRRLWQEGPLANRSVCIHRGDFRETRDCKSCNKNITTDTLYACKKYGLCSDTKSYADANACWNCSDYQSVPAVEFYPGVLDPIADPEMLRKPRKWACRPEVRERHIWALQRLLEATPGPLPWKSGVGIITVGGGKYWPMIEASLHMIRKVTDLPVQVWYRGSEEPVGEFPGVEFVDSTQYPHRILRGWESKTLALLHCPFETVLFLDADAYPVADPQPIIDLARTTGFVAWGDMEYNHEFINWDWFGISTLSGQCMPTVQGGQFAIDFSKFAKPFLIAHWLNQHSDYSYHHPNDQPKEWHCYGDQDCWRVATALTKVNYCHLGPARWEHPAFVCELGKPIFVHRCRGKAYLDKYEVTSHLPGDGDYWERFGRLAAEASSASNCSIVPSQ